jgi:hypothetical protein
MLICRPSRVILCRHEFNDGPKGNGVIGRKLSPEERAKRWQEMNARIDKGEGTVGRLTKDETLINEVQGLAKFILGDVFLGVQNGNFGSALQGWHDHGSISAIDVERKLHV